MRSILGDLLLVGVLGLVAYAVVSKLRPAPAPAPAPGTTIAPPSTEVALIDAIAGLGSQGLDILGGYLDGPDEDNQTDYLPPGTVVYYN